MLAARILAQREPTQHGASYLGKRHSVRNLRKSIPFRSPRVPHFMLLGFRFRPESPEPATRREARARDGRQFRPKGPPTKPTVTRCRRLRPQSQPQREKGSVAFSHQERAARHARPSLAHRQLRSEKPSLASSRTILTAPTWRFRSAGAPCGRRGRPAP